MRQLEVAPEPNPPNLRRGRVAIQYRTPIRKEESWSRLDFLFGNGGATISSVYADFRFSYFPVKLSLPFLLLVYFSVLRTVIDRTACYQRYCEQEKRLREVLVLEHLWCGR